MVFYVKAMISLVAIVFFSSVQASEAPTPSTCWFEGNWIFNVPPQGEQIVYRSRGHGLGERAIHSDDSYNAQPRPKRAQGYRVNQRRYPDQGQRWIRFQGKIPVAAVVLYYYEGLPVFQCIARHNGVMYQGVMRSNSVCVVKVNGRRLAVTDFSIRIH